MFPGRVNAPYKRLLIRPGAIGDFVVSLPALQHLKAPYTEVWCATQTLPLVLFANRTISISSSGINRVGVPPCEDVFERLRTFDEICSWYGTGNVAFRESVANFPIRFFDSIPPVGSRRNATQYFCEQVGAPDAPPTLDTGFRQREDFVILHPFASSLAKRWPLESFRALDAMLERTQWCAGPEEHLDHAMYIPNLFQLAQWISTARAYVGNDSGITHLAAAVGTPVVALFGPTDPAIWAPRGESVRVISGTFLDRISPEQVLAALASLL